MPNSRVRRNSVVDMLSKVHVNRGSLLKSIENLLKTIESSESAVMIPTLLRDKCEFDAWELLFVAKILKASILGHSDLVEFYMNHMGHSAVAAAQQQSNGINGTNGINGDSLSSPIASPGGGLTRHATSPSLSTASSISSVTTATSGSQQMQGSQQLQNQQSVQSRSHSSTSWITANQASSSSSLSSGSFSNSNSTSASSVASSSGANDLLSTRAATTLTSGEANGATNGNSPPQTLPRHQESSDTSALLAARPLMMRQAQPPSLLQLTTTNNHINSMAAGFTTTNMETLTNQVASMAITGANGQQQNSTRFEGALSISTTVANQPSPTSTTTSFANGPTTTSFNGTTPTESVNGTVGNRQNGTTTNNHHHAELRSSRSAGCLFRVNSSGASSPRTPAQTPSTPYPQAETLANGQLANGLLASDPGAPVKLLLQIEQLKTSINHVTMLLDSVVELYKKSIDNIA